MKIAEFRAKLCSFLTKLTIKYVTYRGEFNLRRQERVTVIAPLRRMLFSWWLLRRGLTLGVRGVVVDAAGRVMLVKHSYVSGWHFPGGGVERGEDIGLSLARELREEAGIDITGPTMLHGLFHNGEVFAGDHVAVFIVRDFVERPVAGRQLEIIDRGFFARDALPEGTSAGTRRRLGEVFEGRAISAQW